MSDANQRLKIEAHDASRQHEIGISQHQRLAAHQAGVADPVDDGQRNEIAPEARTQHRNDRDADLDAVLFRIGRRADELGSVVDGRRELSRRYTH